MVKPINFTLSDWFAPGWIVQTSDELSGMGAGWMSARASP